MAEKIETEVREIEVTQDSITILRCELEACLPDNSHDECFRLQQQRMFGLDGLKNRTCMLDVENIGYGDVSVTYSISNDRSFEFPKNKQIEINGVVKLSFKDNSILAEQLVDSKLTLHYSSGEHFVLCPGDEICRGSKTLIKYCEDNDWSNDW